MQTSLAGLDMPVVLPRWVPSGAVEVVSTGTGRADAGGPAYWDDISLGPAGHRGGPRPWTVRTLARRGCRPGSDGRWTVDPSLDRAAATAVVELLLNQIPSGLPADDIRRLVNAAGDTGDRVARRLMDQRTWQRTQADVDGHAFVLWYHRRPEGFAAVADLGPAVLLVHGQVPPDVWVFALAWPEQARALLDRPRRAGQATGRA
ncbi:hypothetical protein [Blastococcus tunisiensis]|uniref:Uncharacterized protein n=1 Tax=Blastococcus tunisiensis TaxID=1798228 RepID=A0A1I2BS46_9ACTN|nr:hypothetical protein [Blastococcus sp. DSM 46838]SFE58919.1 hypothetical protein SAMN05216574_104251 [Blastococcus sp. DSM 46838]